MRGPRVARAVRALQERVLGYACGWVGGGVLGVRGVMDGRKEGRGRLEGWVGGRLRLQGMGWMGQVGAIE